jgi:hypothetical protein
MPDDARGWRCDDGVVCFESLRSSTSWRWLCSRYGGGEEQEDGEESKESHDGGDQGGGLLLLFIIYANPVQGIFSIW